MGSRDAEEFRNALKDIAQYIPRLEQSFGKRYVENVI